MHHLSRPAAGAYRVTPNDAADLPNGPCRFLHLGTTGDVRVTMADGSEETLVALAAGVQQAYQVRRIWATGTTATAITALY